MSEERDLQPIRVERDEGKVNVVLDMSSYDLFELCHARYNYRHNLLRASRGKSSALVMGSLLHEGYEVYYKGLRDGKPFNDRMQETLQRIYYFGTTEEGNADEDEIKTIISAAEQNLEYWRFEDENMIIREVERPFAYVLYADATVRIILTGKIDLFVDIPAIAGSGEYKNLPIDHKTFQRDFEVPRLSNQFMNYANAVNSNFVLVNRVGLQKTLKPFEKFKRVPLSYDHELLDEWKMDVTQAVLHDYFDCIARDFWKRNLTSCFKFNRRCEYYEICESSGSDAKRFKLDMDYIQIEPWDVTKKLESGDKTSATATETEEKS